MLLVYEYREEGEKRVDRMSITLSIVPAYD